MGMRKYCREIARDRLRCMGADHVNSKMGFGISRAKLAEAFRLLGRENRKKLRESLRSAMWRRVLWGDLAADGKRAQLMRGNNRRAKLSGKAKRAVQAAGR